MAFGSFRSTSFLRPERHIPAWPTRTGAPSPTGTEEVGVTVFLPQGAMPAGGWPVAIFGHGFGNERHGIPILRRGDHGPQRLRHGGDQRGRAWRRAPQDSSRCPGRVRDPVTLPAGGRGVDLDGDLRIGVSEGAGTLNRGPLALIGSRDGLRQTVADLMRSRARHPPRRRRGRRWPHRPRSRARLLLRAIVRWDLRDAPHGGGPAPARGCAERARRVHQKKIARLTPIFRALAVEQLKRRRPPLLNAERNFDESIPLFGEPPVLHPAAGALPIQAFLDRAEWLDPVSQPGGVRAVPARGAPRISARICPCIGTTRSWTGCPSGSRIRTAFSCGRPCPTSAAIARVAQEQVARFFASGGRVIERTSEYFEVPAGGR